MVDVRNDRVHLAERKGMDEPLEQTEVRFPPRCVRSVDASAHAKPENWKVTSLL